MRLFIDDLIRYNVLKKMASIVGKPCIWSIISILIESDSKATNITALVSKLNSNYRTIIKCIEYMKKLQIVEVMTIGRIRLVRLIDNQLTRFMIGIMKELKENNNLTF